MKRIRLIHNSPIAEFANTVYTYRQAIYRIWLISPWIGTYTDGSVDPLKLFIESLRSRPKCMVNVITRKPRPNAIWHRDAIQLLSDNVNPTLFYCNTLHTKLYIVETDGMITTMLGSPNLTPGGNTANLELALELRTTSLTRSDEVSSAVHDLVQYAHDLLGDDAVEMIDQ